MTKTAELRNLKVEEVEAKVAEAQEELMNLRFQHVGGQLTDSSRLRVLRRDIARMMTILRERATQVKGEQA